MPNFIFKAKIFNKNQGFDQIFNTQQTRLKNWIGSFGNQRDINKGKKIYIATLQIAFFDVLENRDTKL